MSSKPGSPGFICLGASAGGLRSLEAIVSRLPADLPWPILIAQHLQADRVSQMPQILARVAHMPVREAADGETPNAGTIYTCPSAYEMGVSMEGQITLRAPRSGRPQTIDHLFATASYARPDRTIAVVLSGTGSDGAVGSLVVKLNNGTVIAESDESAEHSQMPAAAHRAGTVDATLAADAMAAVLEDLARGALDEATTTTRAIVNEIARMITSPDGADFAHYRLGTLRRQADTRRAILGLKTLAEYRDRLADSPREHGAFVKSLLIPVTEFFRDAPAWRAIEENVVPVLVKRALAGQRVRVWCAGCASGEEAYTIAILLAESLAERSRVQILASDLDAEAVAMAGRGIFDATRMEGVDASRRDRFFHPDGHGYRVTDDLRKMVQFRVHDVTREDPPGRFDLIICRNLLIYFDEALQSRTVARFRDALAGPQFLYLGRSETLPPQDLGLTPITKNLKIYRGSGRRSPEESDASMPPAPGEALRETDEGSWSLAADVRVEVPDTMVLVVDDAWRVLSANEHAVRLLDADIVGMDLLDIFPRWQGSPVHDALRASSETGRSLKVRGAPTPRGPMDITLERAPHAERATLLIGTPALPRGRGAVEPGILEARQDLAATNDELQSANEELAATNEELQATNEELASLNEEFQSTNQTLASTNVELGAVAKSAQAATALMDEFLQTWREALVACDAAHRVTLFNRKAADLFALDASSIGRPIAMARIGVPPEDLARWLDHAKAMPFSGTVDHLTGKLELTIEHVKGSSGLPLGWVLSWSPVRG